MKFLLCALSFLVLIGIICTDRPTPVSVLYPYLHGEKELTREGEVSEDRTQLPLSLNKERIAKEDPNVFNPIFITTAFIVFLMLLLIPFGPGIVELFRPKDAAPLIINMNYVKDPRYFDKSARAILKNALKSAELIPGITEIQLSKQETLEIVNAKRLPSSELINHVLYVDRNLYSGKAVEFKKEVFVKGRAHIGENNILRAMVCDKNIVLSQESRVIRWISAEGTIEAKERCDLGIRASCERKFKIAKECRFKCLYGKPIITYSDSPEGEKEHCKLGTPHITLKTEPADALTWVIVKKHLSMNHRPHTNEKDLSRGAVNFSKETENIEDLKWVITTKYISIPASTRVEKHIVAKKRLMVNQNCTILGSIKAYEDVVIEDNVTVHGNIFSEGDIRIGEHCVIFGDVFSQGRITIARGTIIGRPKGVKSVIGKKMIELNENIVIYGYVLTEGSGTVL